MSENNDQIEWYIARDGNQHGPLSQDELDKFIEFGHLKPTDLLWRAGFPEWRLASDVFQGPPPEEASEPAGPDRSATEATRQDATKADDGGSGARDEPAQAAASREASEGADAQRTTIDRASERPTASQYENVNAARQQPSSFADAWEEAEQRARGADEPGVASRGAAMAQHAPDHGMQADDRDRALPNSPMADGTRQRDEDDYDFDDAYDEEGGQSSWLAIAATVLILGLIGAGGWFAYNNQDEIAALYSDVMGATTVKDDNIAIVRAPEAASRSAATASERAAGNNSTQTGSLATLKPEPLPTTASISPPQAITIDDERLDGVPLLKSEAWAYARRQFPIWTTKQFETARAAAAAGQSPETINGQLVDAFVSFRRDNAALALLASPQSLQGVASAFVASLRALTARGPEGCYAFISSGEGTAQLAPVYFDPPIETKIDAQMLAIMGAIVEAKSKPMARSPPKAEDFEKLSSALSQRGWSDADLKLFSNPDALSQAKPAVVCRLVTEWFSAQTQLSDRDARDRLIAASLRPVIGG